MDKISVSVFYVAGAKSNEMRERLFANVFRMKSASGKQVIAWVLEHSSKKEFNEKKRSVLVYRHDYQAAMEMHKRHKISLSFPTFLSLLCAYDFTI